MSKNKEEQLVAAFILVNNFFLDLDLPAPINQKAALTLMRASEQRGKKEMRKFVKWTSKPLTKSIQ